MKIRSILIGIMVIFLIACEVSVPENYLHNGKIPEIYPDYTGITLPYNIAPLNFRIGEEAEEYVVSVYTDSLHCLQVTGKTVDIPLKKWRTLLEEGKNKPLYIDIFVRKEKQWEKFNTITNFIAPQAIDPYLSYRLIEPGFVLYDQIALYQRNLTDFSEREIFNNRLLAQGENAHCINCHAYRNYRTSDMQFHVRAFLGGTVIVNNGKAVKVNLKTDSTLAAGVYPAWHPKDKLIAYSVNTTYQSFHIRDSQRVEVQDCYSDLILYDPEANTVKAIVDDPDCLETFPAWSPDGETLYYASANYATRGKNKEDLIDELMNHYEEVRYDLMKVAFDRRTRTFCRPERVFLASEQGKSVSLPRISPDGRYLLFTVGDFGTFHIWHKSSDLWLMDLKTEEIYSLPELNSPDLESYHSWSSNGSWIVFSSRRDDGAYTRPYIAWFGPDGKIGKPFLLPQKDPAHHTQLYKSYNIPEFMIEPVKLSVHDFAEAIRKEAVPAVYLKR